MKTDVRKEVETETELTVDQVYDLAYLVMMHGHDTGYNLPELPDNAVRYVGYYASSPDSITVWMLDGWPIAASAEMDWLNWILD